MDRTKQGVQGPNWQVSHLYSISLRVFFFHLTVQVNVSLLKRKDKIGDVIYVVNSSFLTNTL